MGTLRGEIHKLNRKIDNGRIAQTNEGQSVGTSPQLPNLDKAITVLEAINKTGESLPAHTCVQIYVGLTALDLPEMYYPAKDDKEELVLYGSLIHQTEPDQVGHVQITGRAFFIIGSGDTLINIGEIIYPINDDDTPDTNDRGTVSCKASNNPNLITDIPLGRAINSEGEDSQLIAVNLSGPGGGGKDIGKFKITDVDNDDYIVCNPFKEDDTVDTEKEINIAKPYLLRHSLLVRGDIDYEYLEASKRVATTGEGDDEKTETQVVVPSYLIDDIIFAGKNIQGGTGVTVGEGDDEKDVEWLDLNVDGRAWAAK